MVSLLEMVASYLERDGFGFRTVADHSALEMGITGEHGSYRLVVVVDDERGLVRFLTFLEGRVPEPRRRDVMEFLTRANYGLLVGNFELDLSDGEVRFKYSADVEDADFSYTRYQGMLYTSISLMDRYAPGLQLVLQGAADPAAAVADVEH